MSNIDKFSELIISVLKCFFILLFLGYLLPKFIDYTTYYYGVKSHNNSVFVSNILNSNHRIDNFYMHFIKNYFNGY